MAKKATASEAMANVSKEVKRAGLSYAQTLEARAQRGEMTHQKKFAVNAAKRKEMRGV